MPFTPTHIAAVVPIAWLLRWNVPLSALAIGSMVCDLGVFFPGVFDYWTMHSVAGLATHCLPLGFCIFFLYHWLIKRPLGALLPVYVHSRLMPWINRMPSLGLSNLLVVALCIFVGASTHVFWDSFTHDHRWGTRLIPALNNVAISFDVKEVYWYTVLQHGSSVVFLPILFLAACLWIARQPPVGEEQGLSIPLSVKMLAIVSLIIVPILSYCYYHFGFPGAPEHIVIHEAVKLACTILIVESFFYGLAFSLFERSLNVRDAA